MCFIFTCCGWVIDLVNRLWTFTMTCLISSAVGCVMLTSSMSGIALGYNYSLAEYIELKETNVSIYLKRGVFDDEIADDMDWRRSGRMPVAGHIGENDLRTGAPADDDVSTTLRSGRRLDDSIFESDQNSFEGALMKLTAKPPHQSTEPPRITDDLEMAEVITRHPKGSLDQMKAIQSLIDSRRAMAASAGTTYSPVATYESHGMLPYLPGNNNPNEPGNPDAQYRRRMNPMHEIKPPNLNPARNAVPEIDIGSGYNWVIPKKPETFPKAQFPDYYILSPTYPSAITVAPGTVRPTGPVTKTDEEEEARKEVARGPLIFATRTTTTVKTNKKSGLLEKLEKESEAFNERFLLEGDEPSKNDFIKLPNIGKSSEEEYEDEIKGLPVRKRRSVEIKSQNGNEIHSTKTKTITSFDNASEKSNGTTYFSKNIITTIAWMANNLIKSNNKSFAKNEIKNVVEDNDSQIDNDTATDRNTDQHTDKNEQSNVKQRNKTDFRQHTNGDSKNFLSRLIKSVEIKKALSAETTPEAVFVTVKKNVKLRRRPFESKIVSSKYEPNNKPTRMIDSKETLSNQEMLNSISVNLNEAGLLRNPASSTFVKLLQSTLT